MLDLDLLAHQRAQSLNEESDAWKGAIWSPSFQRLSRSMSDGEVETLVQSCPSVQHFHSLLQFLDAHPQQASETPFRILQNEADGCGLSLADWLRTRLRTA